MRQLSFTLSIFVRTETEEILGEYSAGEIHRLLVTVRWLENEYDPEKETNHNYVHVRCEVWLAMKAPWIIRIIGKSIGVTLSASSLTVLNVFLKTTARLRTQLKTFWIQRPTFRYPRN